MLAKEVKRVVKPPADDEEEAAAAPYEAPLTKAEERDTLGFRMNKIRSELGMTQQQLANAVKCSRSSIAQYETNNNRPPLETLESIAATLRTAPEYLAFGVTMEPKVVMPPPEVLGFAVAHEVQFGDSPEEQIETAKWGLPTGWLRAELGVTSFDGLLIFKVEVDSAGFGYGDRVVVDRSQRRASPPGTFLYWDGVGPAIAQIMVIPGGTGKKGPVARITSAAGTYEVDVSSLQIIGRVRGVWKKA